MSKAFTLIELLVVVLIIGILSAIALPQYQAAVDRAHVATYLDLASRVRDAQNVYFLSNGEYARSLEDLDIGFDISNLCSGSTMSSAWYAWNCKYGFGLDNFNSGSKKVFYLYFCPSQANKENADQNGCWNNKEAQISFYYGTHATYPNEVKCTSYGDRGKRICSQFQ